MTDYQSVKGNLDHAATLLNNVRDTVNNGGDFDLTEFNETLDSACRGAVNLPYDDVCLVRPVLQSLLDDLERMKQQLESEVEAAGAEATDAG